MGDFSYVRAHSLAEAVELLNEPGLYSRVLAGGTDLVLQIKNGEAPCDRVVDITRVPELRAIEKNGRITIGGAVTHSEAVQSELLQREVPFLIQACRQLGSPQIRNVGTLAGNVANAAACADTLPVLVCLDAEAIIVTPDGEQRMPVTDLVTGTHRNCLPQGALISAFEFEPLPENARTAFLRIGRRRAMAIARLSLAAIGALDDAGRVSVARMVPGASFARFKRATAVEELLLGQEPSAELFAAAGKKMAELFTAESGGRWSAPYKTPVIATLTERALKQVFDLK